MLFFVVVMLLLAAVFFAGMKMASMFGGSEAESSVPEEPSSSIPDPFSFTPEELAAPSSSPPDEASQVDAEPESAPVINLSDWNLILVNRRSPLPENFTVELDVVSDYKVDARIADPLKLMFAQAKADGISLVLTSAYRTVEYQTQLYNNALQNHISTGKTPEEATRLTEAYYAIPGHSEHHTGLAVDIVTADRRELTDGFDRTPAFKWLSENAHSYGFIMRYPPDKVEVTQIAYEPWHYRYVGADAATEIRDSGLCLEEYLYVKERDLAAAETKAAEDEADQDPGEAAPTAPQ